MNGTEKLIWEKDGIRIDHPSLEKSRSWIMHSWEAPYMELAAKKVTENRGHILELGFGMGISATAIQKYEIQSHTIIEVHPEIYQKALIWSQDKPNTEILLGRWQDVLPTIQKKFDGVLHDTHAENFANFLLMLRGKCNEGCVVSFYKNRYYDNNFFDIEEVEITEDQVKNFPYYDINQGIYKENRYEIKSTYYNNGVFTKKPQIVKGA